MLFLRRLKKMNRESISCDVELITYILISITALVTPADYNIQPTIDSGQWFLRIHCKTITCALARKKQPAVVQSMNSAIYWISIQCKTQLG